MTPPIVCRHAQSSGCRPGGAEPEANEQTRTEAALAELGELSAVVVHEIRNPLTTIMLALDSFQRLSLPPSFELRLSLALTEGERLKRLLSEILLFSKSSRANLQQLELNRFVSELLKEMEQHPSVAACNLQFQPAPEPLVVLGDRDRLKQVLINLLTNACEAVPPGDRIGWQLRQSSGSAEMRIKNGGPPIPPELLSQITQPFLTTKAEGSGLGLAIVQRIVQAHQGELQIISTPDQGTIVTVRLPLCQT